MKPLDELLAWADIITLHIPRTKETTNIIGEAQMRRMRKGAYLINAARGGLVDEEALLKMLDEGHLAGAALDTHYAYPLPSTHPLWRFPNVILTPHISGSAQSSRFLDRIWDIFVQNVERWLSGQPLLNELSAQQLSGE